MTDVEFLKWLRERLIIKHGENRNYDYMHRLGEIILKMETSLHPLLTPEQVADRYGVSLKRLQNWRENKTGGPSYVKIGKGAVRYRQEDLLTWELTRLRNSEAQE